MAVYVVVVAAHVAGTVDYPDETVVGRHIPGEGWRLYRGMEAQVLCCVVHAGSAEQPHTLEVERHVNLVAGVGVITVDPQLVVRGVYPLHPYFVDEYVGLYLVIVAAVNHHLAFRVEVVHCTFGLCIGEIPDGCC